MEVSAAYICAQGNVRVKNQDNMYFHGKILKLHHVKAQSIFQWKTSTKKAVSFGVFDGMGGEEYGEIASLLAAKALKDKMSESRSGKIPSNILSEICNMANKKIFDKTLELKVNRIGTTAAITYMQYDRIWCCNVGDSKIYRLRNGILTQLSMDHIAEWSEKPNKKPPLTQHLGMNPKKISLFPYIEDYTMESGDKYLICSDGLTDMVALEDIKSIMMESSSLLKCNKMLLKEALDNGGKDNITIVTFKLC